jgi:hypothetical protein
MNDSPKSRTEFIVPIVAVAIAFISLGLSIWQGYENRRHNRLSVKPKLTFDFFKAINDPQIGLVLSNKGTGPALITSWKIIVNDRPVDQEFASGWEETVKRIKTLKKPVSDKAWCHWGAFLVLQAGEARPIFYVTQNEWKLFSQKEKGYFANACKLIKVRLQYASIYEEKDNVEWAFYKNSPVAALEPHPAPQRPSYRPSYRSTR